MLQIAVYPVVIQANLRVCTTCYYRVLQSFDRTHCFLLWQLGAMLLCQMFYKVRSLPHIPASLKKANKIVVL